jgi:tetratricopeptide (TPR) repeat protein
VSKLLFDPKLTTNTIGRDMLLGQFIMFYISYADSAKRGDIGFPGDKNQYVDLLKFADSLFTLVEKGEAKCSVTTLQWRNYKPYADRIKAAYAAVGAGAADTAEKLANRALVLNRMGPQPYDVLWRVAQIRKDEAHQISFLQTAADRLEGDTLNAAVRSNFMFTLGRIQQEFGDAKTDKAQKDKLYRDAAKAYLVVLKEFPTGEEAPYAMQGISISAAVVGDTAISNAAVVIVKANMDKYTDQTVAQAGVLSTAAGKTADAVVFFAKANQMNPYFRDYLYNLSAMMYENKQTAEMIPLVHKLVEMDPSNPDDIMLFTYAFGGLQNTTKDPAVKKFAIDSVMYFGKMAEAMPYRLSYSDFQRQANRTLLVGQVENRSKVAKEFTIEFELLGKDGAVLQKATATVPSVAPGASGNWKVDVPVGGVFGVRYAPLK